MSEERCKVALNTSSDQLLAALAFVPTLFLIAETDVSATLFAADAIVVSEGADPYDHIILTLETH